MLFEFEGEVIEWRGPAPFLFVPVPPDLGEEIRSMSKRLTYGWGVIPALVAIGSSEFSTSLFPRNVTYLVPVKVVIQRAESVSVGDRVTVRLQLSPSHE